MSMMDVTPRGPAVQLNFEPQSVQNAPAPSDVTVDADGLPLLDLERFLVDIRDEPEWRRLADRCVDYYDGNQLGDEVLADFKKWGLPPLTINLIQPTINTVLGMEAKTRTDWEVTFEDEANEDVAAALNVKVNDAQHRSNADRAISNAYAGQIKAGLHWVEVAYNSNPFAYRYRIRDVHRREIWWDWRKREIEDWRYLVRRSRFDADQLAFAFPKFRDMIQAAANGGRDWQLWAERLDQGTGLGQFIDLERAITFDQQDWVDTTRKQISVYEVWYRKYVRGYVARVGDAAIEIDLQNPRHMLAVAGGLMKPVIATYPKLRQALFIGPQRVFDRSTPLPHRKIPYVPFFGFREDLTGAPFGLIRAMLSPQDEINARRSKAMSLMNSRRVEADRDALATEFNTHEDAAEEASRADSYIILNEGRKNRPNGFKVADNADLAQGQTAILEESKKEIHEVSGVFPPMAGDQSGGLSGLAINSLVEQGTQTLAEINDNYTWARREVGELTLELVKADNLQPQTVPVGEGKGKRHIQLNAEFWDNDLGTHVTDNDVSTSQVKLVLTDVPSTPAWRQQQSAQLAEITKSLPPQLQAFVVPFYIESTDIRDRKKIAAIIRRQLGLPEPGTEDQTQQPQIPPEIQAQMQQREEAVQALTQQLQQAMGEIDKLKQDAEGKAADRNLKAQEISGNQRVAGAKVLNDRLGLHIKATDAAHARALAAATPSAPMPPPIDTKSIVNEITQALEPMVEEATAAVHELASEVEERFGELEKRERDEAAKAPAPVQQTEPKPEAAAAPSIVLNLTAVMPQPGARTVTMKGADGKTYEAEVKPSGEPPKPKE